MELDMPNQSGQHPDIAGLPGLYMLGRVLGLLLAVVAHDLGLGVLE